MEVSDQSVDSLNRPEGNSLQENYVYHDKGEAWLKQVLEGVGYAVEDYGIDMRDDDSGKLIYDDKMDYKVFAGDELRAFIDVKTKSNENWMYRYNMRHHVKYYDTVEEYSIPTFVVFCLVKDDHDRVLDHAVVPLHEYDCHECYSSSFRFPDGNEGVYIPIDHRRDLEYLLNELS